MTRKEYLQLLQISKAFHQMPIEMQRIIKKATGKNRDMYAKIFVDELKGAYEAQETFLAQVQSIIREMNFLSNHTKQQVWLSKEQKIRKSENPEALLEQL